MIDRRIFKFADKNIREIPTGWPGVYERILSRGEGLVGISIDSTIRRIKALGAVHLALLDASGTQVRPGTPLSTKSALLGAQIDLMDIEPGMYALRITRATDERNGDNLVEIDGAVPYQLAIEAK